MLILTRRVGEVVCIGDSIQVCVLGAKGNQVRLGITAPKEVSVNREEIQILIDREKQGLPPLPDNRRRRSSTPLDPEG